MPQTRGGVSTKGSVTMGEALRLLPRRDLGHVLVSGTSGTDKVIDVL